MMWEHNDLTLMPWLQDYNRNLSPVAPANDCPVVAPWQRIPRSQTRYGWPREPQTKQTSRMYVLPQKARQAAGKLLTLANIGKLLAMAVFGGGMGLLFLTQWIG